MAATGQADGTTPDHQTGRRGSREWMHSSIRTKPPHIGRLNLLALNPLATNPIAPLPPNPISR